MEHPKLKLASWYVQKNCCEWYSNPCPHQPQTYKLTQQKFVRAWVRIPFADIFTDIPRCWFKLMTFRLLFSNMTWRLSSLVKWAAACLTV